LVIFRKKILGKVGSDEACPTSNQNSHAQTLFQN
jgi:hypothetical protein